MATISNKSTTPSSASTTPAKWPFAKKVVEATPAKRVSTPKVEKPASKQAATTKSSPKKSVKKNTVTPEERYHMIATAAYFRAKQRGFVTGHEMEDWNAGEAQIDAMLSS